MLLLVISGLCFNMFESHCFCCISGFRREVHRLKIRVWGKSGDKGKAHGILTEGSEENTFVELVGEMFLKNTSKENTQNSIYFSKCLSCVSNIFPG